MFGQHLPRAADKAGGWRQDEEKPRAHETDRRSSAQRHDRRDEQEQIDNAVPDDIREGDEVRTVIEDQRVRPAAESQVVNDRAGLTFQVFPGTHPGRRTDGAAAITGAGDEDSEYDPSA